MSETCITYVFAFKARKSTQMCVVPFFFSLAQRERSTESKKARSPRLHLIAQRMDVLSGGTIVSHNQVGGRRWFWYYASCVTPHPEAALR